VEPFLKVITPLSFEYAKAKALQKLVVVLNVLIKPFSKTRAGLSRNWLRMVFISFRAFGGGFEV
jgi:hypothetical protein